MSDDVALFQTRLRALLRRMRAEQPLVEGLSRGAVRMLHHLGRADEATTPGAVADLLGMTSSNVAPLLRELESAGFVRRDRDDADARRIRITLTDRGRAACERWRAGRAEWLREAIATTLDADERALLFAAGELMERLAAAEPHAVGARTETEEGRA